MTFFLMSVFVFLVLWRPQEWLIPWMYGFPLLNIIFGVSLLTLMVESKEGLLRPSRHPLPQYYLLPGLFFAALMSHIAWFYWVGFVDTIEPVGRITVFTMVLLATLDRPSRLRRMALIIVAMTAFMAIHCLLQQRRGYGFASAPPMYIAATRWSAAYFRSQFFGIFEDPNDTAQMLSAALPFSFVLFRRRTLFSLLIGFAVAALLVAGILATHSRGGWVALAATVAIMVALVLPARITPYALGALALGGLISTSMAGPWLEATPYTYDRIQFWAEANWAFKSRPLFGVGFGMIREYTSGAMVTHNAFVSCYSELGLFGYWFWFNLLFLGVVGAWRSRIALAHAVTPEQKYLRRFSGAALASMVGYAASAYFLSRTFVFPIFILFALLAALPSLVDHEMPEGTPPLIEPRRDLLLWGTFATVLSVIYIYVSILLINRVYFGM